MNIILSSYCYCYCLSCLCRLCLLLIALCSCMYTSKTSIVLVNSSYEYLCTELPLIAVYISIILLDTMPVIIWLYIIYRSFNYLSDEVSELSSVCTFSISGGETRHRGPIRSTQDRTTAMAQNKSMGMCSYLKVAHDSHTSLYTSFCCALEFVSVNCLQPEQCYIFFQIGYSYFKL